MESLIFLTKRKDGKIQARVCANGSKQQECTDQEKAASLMTISDLQLIPAGINANKEEML